VLRSTCLLIASGSLLLSCARQSLSSVETGRPAPDILVAALQAETTTLPATDIDRLVAEVDAEVASIRPAAPSTPAQLLAALNRHFFGADGFAALQDLSTPENTSVAAVLENRRGTCMGLAVIYLLLAERLGLSVHAVPTPVHLFIRVQLEGGPRNVELLEEGRELPDDI